MDTYTKQCDCPEIQGLWEPNYGDRVWVVDDGKVGMVHDPEDCPADTRGYYVWLPRQKDWQNILLREHYAPATPTAIKIHIATIIMHREVIDYMEGWGINQPCEAWARLFMNFHDKRWTDEGWV